ncbi:MAG TPA: TIR domain-containing protein [Rhizomicrobium sp.]
MPQRKIFVGSSQEARSTTEQFIKALSKTLGADYVVIPWWETDWRNLETALSTLQDAVREYDYAVFFCYPDDKVNIRKESKFQTRDNVIFEFGLFLSVLTQKRTFLVRPTGCNPEFRILTDLGSSVFMPSYKVVPSSSGRGTSFEVDRSSVEAVAASVGNQIAGDVASNERTRDNPVRAKSMLEARLHEYRSKLSELHLSGASDTRLLNAAGEYIKDFLALKAAATQRSVRDATEDLGIYFDLVEDLLNISQLAAKQRKSSSENAIDEVWVFADDPLEFSDQVSGEAAIQIPLLRQTIADNLRDGVSYYYFVNDQFKIDRARNRLSELNVAEADLRNIQFFRLDRAMFKTFFTVHKSHKSVCAIYMSAIMKGRNDLLIKVSPDQQNRIYDRLESMVGFEIKTSEGIRHRDFFLNGR